MLIPYLKATSALWVALIVSLVLPLGLVLIAGFVWLWQNNSLLIWALSASILSVISWLFVRYLHKPQLPPVPVTAADHWSSDAQSAWYTVEQLARQKSQQDIKLEGWQPIIELLHETVQAVAQHFHPDQKNAILEMRVPELLKVIELLSRDLRMMVAEHIPGSHILTINDLLRGKRLLDTGQQAYTLYRIVSAGLDPIGAAVREIKELSTKQLWATAGQEIKSWLIDAYIKKIGYYAIELYSGHLIIDEAAFQAHVDKTTQAQLAMVQQQVEQVQEAPLRVLVVGQVKAGKSSVVNALFGEVRAVADAIPCTVGVEPYLLERDGQSRAIILDTAGYEEATNPLAPLLAAKHEVVSCDLVLLVCAATSASRQMDRCLLDQLRTLFRNERHEELPVIVVLTHIDLLRPFREWRPPYNVQTPDTPKAQLIRETMLLIAHDLAIPPEWVIPVNAKSGQEYNIDEGLVPTILQLFNTSQRLKYLRCVQRYQDEQYWQQLWVQTRNAGRILVKEGMQWVKQTAIRHFQ